MMTSWKIYLCIKNIFDSEMTLLSVLCVFVPVEAAAVCGCGEEQLRLAQSETLRDPRPDISDLFSADDLRAEIISVHG